MYAEAVEVSLHVHEQVSQACCQYTWTVLPKRRERALLFGLTLTMVL